MKLKQIKPNMAIHCTTKEQVRYLVDNKLAEEWTLEKSLPIWFISSKGTTICSCAQEIYNDGITGNEWCESKGYECAEFPDLIIQELTAEEAVEWLCKHYCDREFNKVFGGDFTMDELHDVMTPDEVVRRITQWKSEREKKYPEIEWFWKSYVVCGSDYKEADTEQEAMEWCEYYVKEHPEAKCTYKHVCRVKAVE